MTEMKRSYDLQTKAIHDCLGTHDDEFCRSLTVYFRSQSFGNYAPP